MSEFNPEGHVRDIVDTTTSKAYTLTFLIWDHSDTYTFDAVDGKSFSVLDTAEEHDWTIRHQDRLDEYTLPMLRKLAKMGYTIQLEYL